MSDKTEVSYSLLYNNFDRKGNKISMKEYMELMKDADYRRVAFDVLESGKTVSTIWLGMDHSFGSDKGPIIFESMVFPCKDNFAELDMRRYQTEEEAIKGHEELINKWTDVL